MSHAVHKLPRRIFGDDCEECVERSGNIARLSSLDSSNIVKLGDLAAEVGIHRADFRTPGSRPPGASYADVRAVDNLRLAARIVFASGITEEVAR